jgi:hypothetical protein
MERLDYGLCHTVVHSCMGTRIGAVLGQWMTSPGNHCCCPLLFISIVINHFPCQKTKQQKRASSHQRCSWTWGHFWWVISCTLSSVGHGLSQTTAITVDHEEPTRGRKHYQPFPSLEGQISLSKKIPTTIKIILLKKIRFYSESIWFKLNHKIWFEFPGLKINLLI